MRPLLPQAQRAEGVPEGTSRSTRGIMVPGADRRQLGRTQNEMIVALARKLLIALWRLVNRQVPVGVT